MEKFEGEWKTTNEIAKIKFERKMKTAGKTEYKGQWYSEEELEIVKELEQNKGIKLGMKKSDVKDLWGKPTREVTSSVFQTTRKREMWVYENEETETEDRVIFENGAVRRVMVDQELSE